MIDDLHNTLAEALRGIIENEDWPKFWEPVEAGRALAAYEARKAQDEEQRQRLLDRTRQYLNGPPECEAKRAPAYCGIHQSYKWCEHNGGTPGATGFAARIPLARPEAAATPPADIYPRITAEDWEAQDQVAQQLTAIEERMEKRRLERRKREGACSECGGSGVVLLHGRQDAAGFTLSAPCPRGCRAKDGAK